MHQSQADEIRLRFSDRFWFRDWPNSDIPVVAAGVYVVWSGDQLIYAGMSGRQIEKNRHKRKYGLVTRLNSHAKGRLSGDQFNVYVANRFVVPLLVRDQMRQLAQGSLTLDQLTKRYIHENFQYQYLVVENSKDAFALEFRCTKGEIWDQVPMLNMYFR